MISANGLTVAQLVKVLSELDQELPVVYENDRGGVFPVVEVTVESEDWRGHLEQPRVCIS